MRFLTFSCQRRLPLFSNHGIAAELVRAIVRARLTHRMELFAWVIMPEHLHLLVRPPEGSPLGPILASMKMSVSKRVIGGWARLGGRGSRMLELASDGHGRPRSWQKGGGFDRNVRSDDELCREIRYIHQNPVKRGLLGREEKWKWLSVR